MHSLDIIRRIVSEPLVSSGLLIREFIIVSPPAKLVQVAALEGTLPRKLSESHRRLLLTWNGLNLEVVRLLGAPPVREGVDPIPKWQRVIPPRHSLWIAIGTDPAGFLYAEDEDGSVWSIDHDGGEPRQDWHSPSTNSLVFTSSARARPSLVGILGEMIW